MKGEKKKRYLRVSIHTAYCDFCPANVKNKLQFPNSYLPFSSAPQPFWLHRLMAAAMVVKRDWFCRCSLAPAHGQNEAWCTCPSLAQQGSQPVHGSGVGDPWFNEKA